MKCKLKLKEIKLWYFFEKHKLYYSIWIEHLSSFFFFTNIWTHFKKRLIIVLYFWLYAISWLLRTKFSRHIALFHWQPAPHQYYHRFWVNLFQSPKEPIFAQDDVKAHVLKPIAILSHYSLWLKLMAQYLIFGSWFKLMSLIGEILGVVVWRSKKYVQ